MASPVLRAESTHEIVVFRVGAISAALPAGTVEDVLERITIFPVRATPGGILGVFDHEGVTGVAVDLHWKLGMAVSPYVEGCEYLVARVGDRLAALRCDAVESAVRVPASAFEMLLVPGSGEGLGYLRGVVRFAGRDIPLLDPELLVSSAAIEAALDRGN